MEVLRKLVIYGGLKLWKQWAEKVKKFKMAQRKSVVNACWWKNQNKSMDGWLDGLMVGWREGLLDGWVGWTNG